MGAAMSMTRNFDMNCRHPDTVHPIRPNRAKLQLNLMAGGCTCRQPCSLGDPFGHSLLHGLELVKKVAKGALCLQFRRQPLNFESASIWWNAARQWLTVDSDYGD